MKKIILSMVAIMLVIVAYAMTYMHVKTTNDQDVKYDINNVEQIDYEKDISTSTIYMRTKTGNGDVDKYEVDNVVEVVYGDINITSDTTGSAAQGTTVCGQVDGYTYVDLGLPSKVLWATYNVGATMPQETGDFFSWGETEPKADYRWATYKWCNGSDKSMTKYCHSSEYGIVDNKRRLDSEDDAATANWKENWRMPTTLEQKEMLNGCSWIWVTNFNNTGVSGLFGTSKTNGNTIFLPAAGYYDGTKYTPNSSNAYWSSETDENIVSDSRIIYNPNSTTLKTSYSHRYYGRTVRAVSNAVVVKIEMYIVNFYTSDSTLIKSQKVEVKKSAEAPEAPVLDGYKFIGWSEDFSNVEKDLNVYAQYTYDQGVSVNGEVDKHTYVDLGLPSGLKWATYNIGAKKPSETGDYFAWGETQPKADYSLSTYKWCTVDENGLFVASTKYCTNSNYGVQDNKKVLDNEDDAAVENWGHGWRMPTAEDFDELLENCKTTWTNDFNGTGMAGMIYTSQNNKNTIFFPATGKYASDSIYGKSVDCEYWTSSLYDKYERGFTEHANYLSISDNSHSFGGMNRHNGLAVRAVIIVHHTVNFYGPDSTLIERKIVEDGKEANAPKAPDLNGYEFVGWSDYSFVRVKKDLNIYAKYVESGASGATGLGVPTSGIIGGYTYVDLGLPSGIRWATCNMGATTPAEYGDYYAWGETSVKEDHNFTSVTYKWAKVNPNSGTDVKFTKYCNRSANGTVDDKLELDEEDDAAIANYGNGWRMPSKDELQELSAGCKWFWTNDFHATGVAGCIGISKYNGNIIFFPATGFYGQFFKLNSTSNIKPKYEGIYGAYWSSSLYLKDSEYAMLIGFQETGTTVEDRGRYLGMPIRPVVPQIYTVNFYTKDSTLIESKQVTGGLAVVAPQAPEVDGYEFIGWNEDISKVIKDLNVYPQYKKKPVTVSGKIGNYPYVDLGLKSGLKWASYNVGATTSTESGYYVSWGETQEKNKYDWSNYKYGSIQAITKYSTSDFGSNINDGKTVLEASDDVASTIWGSTWRIPTKAEMEELIAGCDWEWVEKYNDCNVRGILGTSKANGNIIFLLDADGKGSDSEFYSGGHYWTSTLYESTDPTDAICLLFGEWYSNCQDYGPAISESSRSYGCSVRAVSK